MRGRHDAHAKPPRVNCLQRIYIRHVSTPAWAPDLNPNPHFIYLGMELLCSIAFSRHAQQMDRKNKMNPLLLCVRVCVRLCVRTFMYARMQHTIHTITPSHTFRDTYATYNTHNHTLTHSEIYLASWSTWIISLKSMKRGAWMLAKTVSILLHSCVSTDTDTDTGSDHRHRQRHRQRRQHRHACAMLISSFDYFYSVFIIARRVDDLAQYREISHSCNDILCRIDQIRDRNLLKLLKVLSPMAVYNTLHHNDFLVPVQIPEIFQGSGAQEKVEWKARICSS